ncbi:MAG TPA: hypothetical protein VJT09_12010 [Pyrinomonadaceae bacterium]|nr:hypothetical protein [Pyrinomonadaceae bacterium]
MAASQTVIFTVVPRGVSIDPQAMPVSVVVSPRLSGENRLGLFPDWLKWTARLKERGLTLTFNCAGQSFNAAVGTRLLRPELWAQLFNEETLVRPHKFDDYTERGIISFSVRQTLSALKGIYQEAGLHLALPEPTRGDRQEQRNRARLRSLLDGLDVHWDGRRAIRWRELVRAMNRSEDGATAQQALHGSLDREGLIVGERNASALNQVAMPFAVFHNMPTPPRKDNPVEIDTENLLDFHQALSSLNSYPELQRALGLVFDLELPRDFVKETAHSKFETLSVGGTNFDWSTQTRTPELATAYVHLNAGQHRLFVTAPRSLKEPSPVTVMGLLNLDPERFGLAQVDVDGGMHKAIILAEAISNPDPARNLDPAAQPERAAHPEVFDAEATLPSLRSGGFSLFADRRGLYLLDTLKQGKAFNSAVEAGGAQPRPFFCEDLVRGYRLDFWDSHTNAWHSLHRRSGEYQVGDESFATEEEEGFVQLALTQPAKGANPPDKDLYIHEAIARWAGWSLSVPRPGKHLSSDPDPANAILPNEERPDYAEDQPETPFKMTVKYRVGPGSLPRMRFGARYRIRARAVDLAGNSLKLGDALTDQLSSAFALPRDEEGFTYMRYEPVGAPLIILRETRSVTDPGSAIDRIVIRTYNDDISKDVLAADTAASDRHVVPPRTSVEMGERLGMFDDAAGKLKGDAATWALIAERDAGEFQQTPPLDVAGQEKTFPLEEDESIEELPHLPDPLSRGAAMRDLPGTLSATIGRVEPDAGAEVRVEYETLSDPNPRAGSATLVGFGAAGDWQKTRGFLFRLNEPELAQTDLRPHWDPLGRVLTVYLAKGQTKVVPLSSYMTADDLKLMGVWQWLREYIERITVTDPQPQYLRPGAEVDEIAHVLQRSVEGGHWMLTPPRLITLVHAVQQPLGRPAFTALNVEHQDASWVTNPLQTAPIANRFDPTELAQITAWRRPGATDAFLMGALRVHGPSTAKIDLHATWDDPVDDPQDGDAWTISSRAAHVDELPLPELEEGYLVASSKEYRPVGYYDPEHDQVGFVRAGDQTGKRGENQILFGDAAPRHLFNDTKHHRVRYTAVATSRYREYFPQTEENEEGEETPVNFTRESEPVLVDVPASARPLAASVVYVLPTFGWQRQTETNLKRSVRFGGGLRVYLRRPWFSSGEGELLGVALWSYTNGDLNKQSRDKFKPFITQWGMDPIWQTANLTGTPSAYHFPDAVATDYAVSLEETSARGPGNEPGRIDVAGFPVEFDRERGLWYSDLTINLPAETYMPFVRLALVRYQPHALNDAKVSRAVVADFAQLTPERSAMVTSDPHHPRTLRVVVSGVAPRGPKAVVHGEPPPAELSKHPTQIRVRVQERDATIQSDLAWRDVAPERATVQAAFDDHPGDRPDMALWSGTVSFAKKPEPGRFRLLIEEQEYVSANYTLSEGRVGRQPGRLIYAETFELDDALVSET